MDKVTIHFHGGTKAVALITSEDIEDENERLSSISPSSGGYLRDEVERIDTCFELIESAITKPPRPRWAWIGDVYIFTQAVCGFEMHDDAEAN